MKERENDFWNFLDKEKEIIFGFENWESYRRAVGGATLGKS
jgi:hypothetical protein